MLPCSSPNESHQTGLLRSNVLRFSCLMSFIELSELRRNTPRITDQSSHISKESHLLLLQGFFCKGIIKNYENKTRSSLHPTVMDVERAGIDRNHPDPNARPTLAVVHHLLPSGNHLSAGRRALHNACRCDSWNNGICPFMLQLANLLSKLHILCGSLTV